MIMPSSAAARALPLALLLTAAGAAPGQSPAPGSSTNKGKLTSLNDFSQGFTQPGRLVEVTSGTFAGIAVSPSSGPRAFVLTSQGALNSTYVFPANAFPIQTLVQAVNGRLYGAQGGPEVNFSLGVDGSFQTYPKALVTPPDLSVQQPDGNLYGTEATYLGSNMFVRMTLNGALTVLHSFSVQEGIPYVLPILASDGNFYGISGLGTGNPANSTSAMVYRMTPQGNLTILATYPDGRQHYGPGTFQETLLQAANGKLYGTAALGGSQRAGAIFEISLNGDYKVLHEYTDFRNGSPTFLTEATDGNLYGVTQGEIQLGGVNTLYRISPSGNYEQLQILNGAEIGNCPCWLTQGSDGKFYGTTMNGGPVALGTAWTWDLGLPKPLPKLHGPIPTSGAVGTQVTIWGEKAGHYSGRFQWLGRNRVSQRQCQLCFRHRAGRRGERSDHRHDAEWNGHFASILYSPVGWPSAAGQIAPVAAKLPRHLGLARQPAADGCRHRGGRCAAQLAADRSGPAAGARGSGRADARGRAVGEGALARRSNADNAAPSARVPMRRDTARASACATSIYRPSSCPAPLQ